MSLDVVAKEDGLVVPIFTPMTVKDVMLRHLMGLLPHRRHNSAPLVDGRQLVDAMKSGQVNDFLAKAKAYSDSLVADGRDHSRAHLDVSRAPATTHH